MRLGERMRALAGGDLTVEIDETERRDEIGDMAKAVQKLVRQTGLGASGASIVLLTGVLFGQAGATDALRVVRVA